MAALTRYTQTLFASSGLTGTGGFGAAANGTTTTETASSNTPSNIMTGTAGAWDGGWLSATLGASKFPAIEDMNAKDYAFSYQIAYILEKGIPEYDTGTTYYQFDIAKKAGTYQLFGSLTNSNVGNALPTAPNSNANWTYLGDLSQLAASNFFSGGTTTGSANAQVLSTVTPNSFSLSTNGATVACTAGFTNSGGTTFNIAGTGATTVKKNSGSGLVALTGGEINAGDTVFLTVNTAGSCLVLTEGPTLGALASLGIGYGLVSSGGNANVSLTETTAALGSNVALNVQNQFFDCQTIASTSGLVYDVIAKVSIKSASGTGSSGIAKLWDGTTVIDSAPWSIATQTNATKTVVPLFGKFTSAGNNIKVSVECTSDTNCTVTFNDGGNSTDSNIKIMRIA